MTAAVTCSLDSRLAPPSAGSRACRRATPRTLLDFADRRLKELAHRDVIAAIVAQALGFVDQDKERLNHLKESIDALAAPRAKMYLEAIKAGKDNAWVDGFLAFRDEFEYADAAAEVMKAYDALRAKHDTPAQKAMGEARGLFQQGRRDDGYAKAKEVVDKYYASSSYRLAKKWLAERKGERGQNESGSEFANDMLTGQKLPPSMPGVVAERRRARS